jgi:HK97 family phage major capsid protein
MQSLNELRGRIQASARAARNLLEEQGSRTWTPTNQAEFDRLLDDADCHSELLAAHTQRTAALSVQREGLEIFLRKRAGDMTTAERAKVNATMSTATGSQGGYATQTPVASEVIDVLKGYGWMRQVAYQFTTTTGADFSYPTSDGTLEVGELIGQNSLSTTADPSFGTCPIPTYKYSSKVITAPIELVQDSNVDIVAWFNQRAVDRIGRIQNQHFTTGTGSGQPTGLVTASSVGKVGATGQTLTITYDDLVDLVDSVNEAAIGMPSKQNGMPSATPGWMMTQTMRKVIRKVKDTSGRPIWLPSFDDGTAVFSPPQLLGYPVYINNDMPVPAANAKSLAFGNLGRYAIRDALEVGIRRFDDSAYTRLGQVGFLAWARSGGNLLDTSAVVLYQHSAT